MNMKKAIAEYNKTGKYFFSKDTVKFWGSRIESVLIDGEYFVTSEDNFDRTKRLYTVRKFSNNYQDIVTVGEFQAYETLEEATAALLAIG